MCSLSLNRIRFNNTKLYNMQHKTILRSNIVTRNVQLYGVILKCTKTKKLDFKPIGMAIKKACEAKGWTQEHLAQLVDLTPRSIMYIKNRGQHPRQRAIGDGSL